MFISQIKKNLMNWKLKIENLTLKEFDYSDRVKKALKLIEISLPLESAYHDHKETMAHVGMAIQIAFCTGVITLQEWPPNWIGEFSILGLSVSPQLSSFCCLFSIWLLIHVFVRWQLRNRRYAAIKYSGLHRALGKWTFKSPKVEELVPYDPNKHIEIRNKFPKHTKWANFLDKYFIPRNIWIKSDTEEAELPVGLVEEIACQACQSTGAMKSEWLLTIGSFVLISIVALSTFF